MIKGTGVDIIEIERVMRAITRTPGFCRRVFTPGEIEYCRNKAGSGRYFAARFAAKEAVLKAIGTGIKAISLAEIEVYHTKEHKPQIRLHGKALSLAQRLNISGFELSMSHSRDYAVAFVIAF